MVIASARPTWHVKSSTFASEFPRRQAHRISWGSTLGLAFGWGRGAGWTPSPAMRMAPTAPRASGWCLPVWFRCIPLLPSWHGCTPTEGSELVL